MLENHHSAYEQWKGSFGEHREVDVQPRQRAKLFTCAPRLLGAAYFLVELYARLPRRGPHTRSQLGAMGGQGEADTGGEPGKSRGMER